MADAGLAVQHHGPEVEQSPDTVLLLSTLPDAATAERLARQLVDERMIACANLLPDVRSVYRWSGAVRTEPEVLMLMKTVRARLDGVIRRVAELHPYEVPEVLAFPAEAGLRAYGAWVAAEAGAGTA